MRLTPDTTTGYPVILKSANHQKSVTFSDAPTDQQQSVTGTQRVASGTSSKQTGSFRLTSLMWAEKFLWERVAESTRQTYQTGFNRFLDFLPEFGTDVRMRLIPNSWNHERKHFPIIYSFEEAVILSYLVYLRRGVPGSNPVTPDTAFLYLTGVKFMLTNIGVDTTILNNSQIIKGVKTGMLNAWRKQDGNKLSQRITMPFVLSMILRTRQILLRTGRLIDRCNSTCQIHSYTTFSRISEAIPTTKRGEKHFLRTKHVIFDVQNIQVTAQHIHKYPLSEITGITIIIGQYGTKNDQEGRAHSYHYLKNNSYSHERDQLHTYCYVTTMYEWAIIARPLDDDPFFSCNTSPQPWVLTPRVYTKSIKDGAQWCGVIDTKYFSSRSTRVAAASASAAANLPDYTIQALGRWKSTAFLRYIRASTAAFQKAYEHLTNINTITLRDVSHTIPGFANNLKN